MIDPTRPLRIAQGDRFYAALVQALDEAGPEGAVTLLTRLTLILADEVGDAERLEAALRLAQGGPPP